MFRLFFHGDLHLRLLQFNHLGYHGSQGSSGHPLPRSKIDSAVRSGYLIHALHLCSCPLATGYPLEHYNQPPLCLSLPPTSSLYSTMTWFATVNAGRGFLASLSPFVRSMPPLAHVSILVVFAIFFFRTPFRSSPRRWTP